MMKKVDVAIIGGGPASIYAAYEFVLKYPKAQVLILEEGHAIDFRSCPIIAGKVEKCVRCTPCSIMRGFGGAGDFSDGKYNFTTAFGGWLTDFMPKREVMELIDYVDLQMADTTSSWHMQPDGTYVRHSKDAEGKPLLDCQEYLIKKHMRKKATN